MIDKVHINQVHLEQREDRWMWTKRRRRGSRVLARGANCFFRLAGNPVFVVEDPWDWQQHELASFRLLHGEGFLGFCGEGGSVWLERLPGLDLDTLNYQGRLTRWMFYAAGREFRRVHGLYSPRFQGPWSHGDPNFGNVIVDERNQRARLIDFETVHVKTLPPNERHADDVAVFLLDLVGGVAEEKLLEMATAFLAGYDRPTIEQLAVGRLALPSGWGRLWWGIRTEYAPAGVLRRRVALLRQGLASASAATPFRSPLVINPPYHRK